MEFVTDFEAANATPIEVGDRLVRFVAEGRRSPQPMWFYFRLADIPEEEIEFRLENAGRCLGGVHSFGPVRPVVTCDGANWERMEQGEIDADTGVFTFRHRFAGPEARVAFCYPYTYSDITAFMARLRESEHAQVDVVGTSGHGRDVYHALITEDGDPSGKPFGMWMTARHHAGETPGSYVMQGFVDGMLADTETAAWARRNIALNIIPAVNVDNCAEGGYGKDEAPRDFNRDYRGPSSRPEVIAIRAAIARWAETHPYQLFLDMHAPAPGEGNFAFLMWRELITDEFFAKRQFLLEAVARNAPETCDFSLDRCRELRGESTHPRASTYGQWRDHAAVSMTLETGYHQTDKGHVLTQESYLAYGQSILEAVREYFGNMEQGP